MSNKHNNNSKGSLLLIAALLFILPPVGIALLVIKLLENRSSGRAGHRHPYNAAQAGRSASVRTGARTTNPQAFGGKVADPLADLSAKAKRLTRIGGIVSIISAALLAILLSESLFWLPEDIGWFLEDMVELLPFWLSLGGGLGAWWSGRKKAKTLSRWRQYLAMVGKNTSIPLSQLAAASGLSLKAVREEIQEMLDEGLFPAGFLDYGADRLVLSAEGLKEEKPAPKPDPATREDEVLREIRALREDIDNQKIAGQIDRIGIITARIFDFQKSHPAKAPELHSFLSYYLPTTLKLLRSYAQLEHQGVQGENITAAMGRIETMMDKVVEGFEKQLDQLFHSDVLDITADVQVLEQMLKKDGLSGQGVQLTL